MKTERMKQAEKKVRKAHERLLAVQEYEKSLTPVELLAIEMHDGVCQFNGDELCGFNHEFLTNESNFKASSTEHSRNNSEDSQ